MLDREKCEEFVRWTVEKNLDGWDLDGGDVQDKLLELGLVEEREVNPEENEWGADRLFFVKEV